MNVSVRSCNVVHLKTATNWWTSHTSHQPSCTKPHTGEQIFLFGFTGGCEVNDNESKDLFYGVWPHPCCVDEWEGAISVDIQTVNIQTIYLNQIAQHSFSPHSQMLFESLRAACSGDMPHYSSLTQVYSLLLLCFLIKKIFWTNTADLHHEKEWWGAKFANFLDAIFHIYHCSQRCFHFHKLHYWDIWRDNDLHTNK